jgi:hypothetical protein
MNLYDVSVPVYVTMLENLASFLTKSQAWATENGKSDEDILQARLAPDMFPLVKQVQIASDNAKSISAQLAGEITPVMEDAETTIAALIERARKTVEFLKTLDRKKFESAADCRIPFPYVPGTYLSGHEALLRSYLPNFFFHVTTAYDILRNQGVPLGKTDFIGTLPLKKIEQ